MEDLVRKNLTKSIGVSNCTLPVLVDILTYAEIKPVNNQIELHPYVVQKEMVDYTGKNLKVTSTAYAPLGAAAWPYKKEEFKKLNLLTEPVIVELA
jgi:diketogulonate reductase-like aldo/keto reductase